MPPVFPRLETTACAASSLTMRLMHQKVMSRGKARQFRVIDWHSIYFGSEDETGERGKSMMLEDLQFALRFQNAFGKSTD